MIFPNKRILFTIREVCKICGIGRTTLLRMEDDGFLTPYFVDKYTGYRYYDTDNITLIGQYKVIMELDISRVEALQLYFLKPEALELLKEKKKKVASLYRLLCETEMKISHETDFTYIYENYPQLTCYSTLLTPESYTEKETLAYDTYQHLLKEGFHVDVMESIFGIISESQNGSLTLCIPLIDSQKEDPRVITFQACCALTTIVHGRYSDIPILIEKFNEELSKRGLKATGQLRCYALIAPVTGEHYKEEDYCFKIVAPIGSSNPSLV